MPFYSSRQKLIIQMIILSCGNPKAPSVFIVSRLHCYLYDYELIVDTDHQKANRLNVHTNARTYHWISIQFLELKAKTHTHIHS